MNLVHGFMMEGRPEETRRDDDGKILSLGTADLDRYLEGEDIPNGDGPEVADVAIDAAHREDGASELVIAMRREMRSVDPSTKAGRQQRAGIRAKYAALMQEADRDDA